MELKNTLYGDKYLLVNGKAVKGLETNEKSFKTLEVEHDKAWVRQMIDENGEISADLLNAYINLDEPLLPEDEIAEYTLKSVLSAIFYFK